MRTQEEAVLFAALNEDAAELERLIDGMLPGEIMTLLAALKRVEQELTSRFWEKKQNQPDE